MPRPKPANLGIERVVEGNPYRFSTDEFYRIVDLEILPDGHRASLWDGLVYEKPPKTQLQACGGMMLLNTLCRLQIPGWFFRFDNSVTIGPDRAPAPDMTAIRGPLAKYRHRRPEAADAGLVIEMNDPILKNDVARKLRAYAEVGIPAYWVVDLVAKTIRAHSDPIPEQGRYASASTYRPGELIWIILDGEPIGPVAVSDLLPTR